MAHDGGRQPNSKKTNSNAIAFLSVLASTANVAEACRVIGVSRWNVYRWREDEEFHVVYTDEITGEEQERIVFKDAWDAAVDTATDSLEREAWRRAKEGWDEPLSFQGRITFDKFVDPLTGEECIVPHAIRKYSDRLLEVLLKAHRPEKFREKFEVAHKGAAGVMIVPGMAANAEDWAAKYGQKPEEKKPTE